MYLRTMVSLGISWICQSIAPEETLNIFEPFESSLRCGLRDNPEDLSDVWCEEEVLFDWATRAMGQVRLQPLGSVHVKGQGTNQNVGLERHSMDPIRYFFPCLQFPHNYYSCVQEC